MTRPSHSPTDTIHVRKYPNRRLYDQTRGGHITHEELYDVVAGGGSVVVTDTATGSDITNLTLVQVLIERDPVKLAAFPPAMLHQVIRTSDQILHSFITRYFNQVMEAFLAMRQQFESMLPVNAAAMPLTPFDWAMTMMRVANPGGTSGGSASASSSSAASSAQSTSPLEADDQLNSIDSLRREVQRLEEQFRVRKPGKTAPRPSRGNSAKSGTKRPKGAKPKAKASRKRSGK